MNDRLTREEIIAALLALDGECAKRGISGEICIYGGAYMVLVFDARPGTRDVDAVFRPKLEVLEAARVVADELGIPPGWLNDGVKGFLSHHETLIGNPVSDLEGLGNLRVFSPSPEYLLAMKCLAARADDTSEDRRDVEFLVRKLNIASEEDVFEIVGRYYPLDRIHVRTRYFVKEVLSAVIQSSDPGASP